MRLQFSIDWLIVRRRWITACGPNIGRDRWDSSTLAVDVVTVAAIDRYVGGISALSGQTKEGSDDVWKVSGERFEQRLCRVFKRELLKIFRLLYLRKWPKLMNVNEYSYNNSTCKNLVDLGLSLTTMYRFIVRFTPKPFWPASVAFFCTSPRTYVLNNSYESEGFKLS